MDLALLSNHPLYVATALAYLAAFWCYLAVWVSPREVFGKAGTTLMLVGAVGNLGLIVGRWMAADRPPFKSLFESMVFLGFCIAVLYVVVERIFRTRVFGALAALGCVGAMAFALFKWDAEIMKLPPALQSAWFIPHVVVYFVGYAALFFATTVSLVQLFRPALTLKAGRR